MNTGTCDVMQILFLIGCFFSFVQALLAEVAKQQFVCNAKGWMLKHGDAKFPKIPCKLGDIQQPKVPGGFTFFHKISELSNFLCLEAPQSGQF